MSQEDPGLGAQRKPLSAAASQELSSEPRAQQRAKSSAAHSGRPPQCSNSLRFFGAWAARENRRAINKIAKQAVKAVVRENLPNLAANVAVANVSALFN